MHLIFVEAVGNAAWWLLSKEFKYESVREWGFLGISVAVLFSVAWYLSRGGRHPSSTPGPKPSLERPSSPIKADFHREPDFFTWAGTALRGFPPEKDMPPLPWLAGYRLRMELHVTLLATDASALVEDVRLRLMGKTISPVEWETVKVFKAVEHDIMFDVPDWVTPGIHDVALFLVMGENTPKVAEGKVDFPKIPQAVPAPPNRDSLIKAVGNLHAKAVRYLTAYDEERDFRRTSIIFRSGDRHKRLKDALDAAKNGYEAALEELLVQKGLTNENWSKLVTIYQTEINTHVSVGLDNSDADGDTLTYKSQIREASERLIAQLKIGSVIRQ